MSKVRDYTRVQLSKADLPVYRVLGAPVVQQGTNGYWVDREYHEAFVLVLALEQTARAEGWYVAREDLIARVRAIGTRELGSFESVFPRFDAHIAARLVHAAILGLPLGFYVDGLFDGLFVAGLGPDAAADVRAADIRVRPDGTIDVLFGGERVHVDRELIDACTVERRLAGEAAALSPVVVCMNTCWVVASSCTVVPLLAKARALPPLRKKPIDK